MSLKPEELIQRRHPEWRRYYRDWEILRLAYEGGDEWKRAAISPYSKDESPLDLIERISRVPNSNHTRYVVGAKRNILFRQGVERSVVKPEGGNTLWQAFNRDVDARGTSRLEFDRRLFCLKKLYSWAVVLIDKSEPVKTLAAAIEHRAFPYVAIFRPQDCLDWGVDVYGKLKWILLRESTWDDDDPWAKPEYVVETYLLWTREYWQRITARVKQRDFDRRISYSAHSYAAINIARAEMKLSRDDVTADEKTKNPIGEVPVVIVRDGEHDRDPVIGDNNMIEIADLSRGLLNLRCNLDQQVLNSVYAFLAVIGDVQITKQRLGMRKALKLPKGGDVKWINAAIEGVSYILSLYRHDETTLLHKANLKTGYGEEERPERMSGVAHEWDSRVMGDELADDAREMERVNLEIDRLFGLWEGIGDFETRHSMPRSFSVTAERELLEQCGIGLYQNWPAEAARELLRRTVSGLFPRLPVAREKEIMAAIDAWSPESTNRRSVLPRGFGLNTEANRRIAEMVQ